MSNAQTKTVQGFFGEEKQVTREEFIKQWTSTVSQYWNLANTVQDAETIDTILMQVRGMAERKWEQMK